MKCIFLGGLYPKEIQVELFQYSHGKLSFAANLHQWNMIEGLESNLKCPVDLISAYFLPTYPKYEYKKVKSFSWRHCNGANDIGLGFINIRGIRQFDQARQFYACLKRWLVKNYDEKRKIVFIYTLSYPMMSAVYKLKKRGFSFHACLIVPDIPSLLAHYGERKDLYSKLTIAYNLKHLDFYLSAADSFVLLTEQMKDMLKVGRKPYCVIDGLYSVKNKFEDAIENSGKTMVYTGSLHREYGICELLSAFCCEESEDWKLIIAGSGNAEDEVKKAEKEQSNIVFLGTLQMPEILKLQREATILVNPRPVDGIDAKYSFPSKTMEYMLSGRPVFMNLLPGMDPIYADYLLTPERFQTDSFKKALPMVMKMEQKELNMIGKKAQMYVLDHKASNVQMKKVVDMIDVSLHREK